MTSRRSAVSAAQGLVCGLFLAACLLVPFVQAGAATVRERVVYHITKVESMEVADAPGHVIGVGQGAGLFFTEAGEVGSYAVWFSFDYVNGSGTHESYGITTFADGSTRISRGTGTTKASQDGKTSELAGTDTYTGGTGRFQGNVGKGSYTGKRVSPLAAGADTYVDFTETGKPPAR